MNSEAMTTFAARLRHCAKLAGSGDRLAQISAVPRRTLESYLGGHSEPNVSRLVALAEAAGVSVGWLATGQGSMQLDPPALGVGLPLPEPAAGAPPALHPEMLATVIREVETWLEQQRKRLTAEKKAEVVALIYEMVLKEKAGGGQTNPAREVGRILRLVA